MSEVYHPRKQFPPARPGYKYCNICGQEKPLEEFRLSAKRGKVVPYSYCLDCEHERDRLRAPVHKPRKTPKKPDATRLGYKVCNTCWDEKPFSEFSRVGNGYAGRCTQCKNERYNNASEEERARRKAVRKISEDKRRDEIRAADRKRHNTDEHNAARRRYQNQRKQDSAYRQVLRDAHASWRAQNPLANRELSRRYKARKRVATTEDVDYKHILERDGLFCYICFGKPISVGDLEFDHVIPLMPRYGEPLGTHSEDNIKPVHKICNNRKRNKPLEALTDFDRRGPDIY